MGNFLVNIGTALGTHFHIFHLGATRKIAFGVGFEGAATRFAIRASDAAFAIYGFHQTCIYDPFTYVQPSTAVRDRGSPEDLDLASGCCIYVHVYTRVSRACMGVDCRETCLLYIYAEFVAGFSENNWQSVNFNVCVLL
jgi:hypothetical protein